MTMRLTHATGRQRARSCPDAHVPDQEKVQLPSTATSADTGVGISNQKSIPAASILNPVPRSAIPNSHTLASTGGAEPRHFNDLTALLGKKETPAGGDSSEQSSICSARLGRRPSMRVRSTSGQESSSDTTVEERSSRATAATSHANNRSASSEQEKDPLDQDDLLRKYQALLQPCDWEEFASVVTRERDSKGYLVRVERPQCQDWKPSMVGAMDRDNHEVEILLVEEVDIGWLMALDAKFDLDPAFVLSYAGFPATGRSDDDYFMPHDDCRKVSSGKDGRTGSWYKMIGQMNGIWQHGEISPTKCPWYREQRRCRPSSVRSTCAGRSSVIACYCLTDKLRKS